MIEFVVKSTEIIYRTDEENCDLLLIPDEYRSFYFLFLTGTEHFASNSNCTFHCRISLKLSILLIILSDTNSELTLVT